MKRLFKILLIVPLIAGLAGAPAWGQGPPRSPIQAEENQRPQVPDAYYTSDELAQRRADPPGELILFDAAVMRPLGMAACALGLVGSILVAPWAVMSHSEGRVGRELGEKPFKHTFERPLGDVDY